MKTFDEALGAIHYHVEVEKVNIDEVRAKAAELHERKHRYDSLWKEVQAHPRYREMMDCWIDAHTHGDAGTEIYSVICTAFMSGLIVGIEMEKQDLEPLASEASAG